MAKKTKSIEEQIETAVKVELAIFNIIGHEELLGSELKEMGCPCKSSGKSYMTFKIEASEIGREESEVNVIDILANLPKHVNGVPVFIEPKEFYV